MLKTIFVLIILLMSGTTLLYSGLNYATISNSYVTVDFSKIQGHSISTNATLIDWRGVYITNLYNTEYYSSNEYIWYDAPNDDTGNGHYTYPLNSSVFTPQSADIKQFRVTYDSNFVYFMVETYGSIGAVWAGAILIVIDTGTPNMGMHEFIEGDGKNSQLGPDAKTGCDKILFDYELYAFATTQCMMWDATGKLVDIAVNGGSTTHITIKSPVPSQYHIRVPIALMTNGNPSNHIWHFIVGAGFNDSTSTFRLVFPQATFWNGGGGASVANMPGPSPNIYDLIGANKQLQEQDLNNYYPKEIINVNANNGEAINLSLDPNPVKFQEQNLKIIFSLEIATKVTLKLMDYYGREIETILDGQSYPAVNSLTLYEIDFSMMNKNNQKIKPGLYFIQGIFETDFGSKVLNKMVRLY